MTTPKNLVRILAEVAALSFALTGCGGGSATTTPPPQILSIVTTTLLDGTIGAAYSQRIEATGGVAPFTWNVSSVGRREPPATLPLAALSEFPPAWMPPDVDAVVPSVDPGVVCPLNEVLRRTSMRMNELVENVDRFSATETLKHERIKKSGALSAPQIRRFDYLVSVAKLGPGDWYLEEYRAGASLDDFPDHIATLGLPSLVLVFHPLEVDHFDFACEGLSNTSSGRFWLVHFRQRPDKPSTLRGYRKGQQSSVAVDLKGRAWIAADSFQVARLETDLVRPYPEIRLASEHTAIEYGPVRFHGKDVTRWLPQTAEVYFDWRGRRIHRSHTFSNFLLYSVDEKQTVLPPKVGEVSAP
jgi:hypothetical protein